MRFYDYAIVGAGIAGAAFAARVAPHASVLLLETEPQPGYHSTGRSAALYTELYGNEHIRTLSRVSRGFFVAPPAGFAEHPLLKPRGRLYVGRAEDQEIIEGYRASPLVLAVSAAEARARVPVLRAEAALYNALDTSAHDIDVHALHQGFLRMAKSAGATLVCNAQMLALEQAAYWRIVTETGLFEARVVVNAAGAWADTVATLAGLRSLGISPLRRTAVIIDSPDAIASTQWPAVVAADASYYFKPDAGLILVSPCDETPVEPGDAQPEELDIAIGIDRLETATTLRIRRVVRSWAGLRSFAPGRSPVVGYDPTNSGFFWLAGLGGYGVQTAPALSELAASIALRQSPPQQLADMGLQAALFDPARLRPVISV